MTRPAGFGFSQFLNHQGTLFGGHALRMMDTAAFVAATRDAIAAAVGGLSSRPLTRQAVSDPHDDQLKPGDSGAALYSGC